MVSIFLSDMIISRENNNMEMSKILVTSILIIVVVQKSCHSENKLRIGTFIYKSVSRLLVSLSGAYK